MKMLLQNHKQNRISMIRGTNCSLDINISDAQGMPYSLPEGACVRFGVKFALQDNRYSLKKDVYQGSNGVFRVELAPEDTLNMSFGSYFYDVGIQEGAAYHNVIPAAEFLLRPNVTEKED